MPMSARPPPRPPPWKPGARGARVVCARAAAAWAALALLVYAASFLPRYSPRRADRALSPEPPFAQCATPTRFCTLRALLRDDRAARRALDAEARKKHELSVIVAVKDAGDLMHEFVVRNYLAGVDHFYVWDDNTPGGDDMERILAPLSPLVTIVQPVAESVFLRMIKRSARSKPFALTNRQHRAYWYCYLKFGERTRWMLTLDADEFLEAKDPAALEAEVGAPFADIPFMQVFLEKIKKTTPSQTGRWNTAMSNRRLLPPKPSSASLSRLYPELCGLRENFTASEQITPLHAAKTVVQPRYLNYKEYTRLGAFFLHGMKHWRVADYFEVYFKAPYKRFHPALDTSATQWYIVHYWSRSLADYLVKIGRGRMSHLPARIANEMFGREEACYNWRNRMPSHPSRASLSATLRQDRIEYLLSMVSGRDAVQKEYYDKAYAELNSTSSNQEAVQKYRALLKKMGAEEQ